jgi:uncharacterized protein DUF4440
MKLGGWGMVVSFAACSLLGQQASDSGTVAQIRALEQEWATGQSRNNNQALASILDNALVYVEYGRLVPKSEYLLRIRQEDPALDQIVLESTTVRTFGTTAIVSGSYREKQVKGGHLNSTRWRFLDTWVYKANQWVLVSAAATPISK